MSVFERFFGTDNPFAALEEISDAMESMAATRSGIRTKTGKASGSVAVWVVMCCDPRKRVLHLNQHA